MKKIIYYLRIVLFTLYLVTMFLLIDKIYRANFFCTLYFLLNFIYSFIMILTVYGRFFKIYIYTIIAPILLSSFAGEPTQSVGTTFLKSYCAKCMEGVVIIIACIIFSLYATSTPVVDTSAEAVTMIWKYIGDFVFQMLVLVGTVKMSDAIVREKTRL